MTGSPFRPRPLVVHLITRYLGGGSEQRLRDMVAGVTDMDHVVLVGEAASVDAMRTDLGGARVEVLPTMTRSLHPTRDIRAARQLRSRLRGLAPDLVVTHQSKAGVIGRWVASRLDVPAVQSLSMASFGPGYPRAVSATFRAIERAMVPRTAAYAAVGEDLADDYRRLGAADAQLRVIRSAVRLPNPPSDRDHARRRLLDSAGLAGDRPVVAYVGSLEPRKNVLSLLDLLVRAAEHSTPGREPVLVIAGDGPQRGEMESEIAALGLEDDVAMLGYVDDPGPVFRGASVVALLSRTEGLPQVLVQAAAAGTPFVSFDVSGASELIRRGATGHVLPFGSIEPMARAIATCCATSRTGAPPIDLDEWAPGVSQQRYRDLFASLVQAPSAPADP